MPAKKQGETGIHCLVDFDELLLSEQVHAAGRVGMVRLLDACKKARCNRYTLS